MGCRVGMSTSPQDRINFWKAQEGHTNGIVLASGLTYRQALDREKSEAQSRGCYYYGGGSYVSGRIWSVYYVSGVPHLEVGIPLVSLSTPNVDTWVAYEHRWAALLNGSYSETRSHSETH